MPHEGSLSPVPELSFLPAHIGAEPGRAKRDLHAHAQNAELEENHIWNHFLDSFCGNLFVVQFSE